MLSGAPPADAAMRSLSGLINWNEPLVLSFKSLDQLFEERGAFLKLRSQLSSGREREKCDRIGSATFRLSGIFHMHPPTVQLWSDYNRLRHVASITLYRSLACQSLTIYLTDVWEADIHRLDAWQSNVIPWILLQQPFGNLDFDCGASPWFWKH